MPQIQYPVNLFLTGFNVFALIPHRDLKNSKSFQNKKQAFPKRSCENEISLISSNTEICKIECRTSENLGVYNNVFPVFQNIKKSVPYSVNN